MSANELTVRIFADGADLSAIEQLARNPLVSGFTTNPTLMRQAGVQDYLEFAEAVLEIVGDRPLSLEVFSDDFAEMERQASLLSALGKNVYVKIPVTNTSGISTSALVRRLTLQGTRVNVTALMTLDQVSEVAEALSGGAPACISVFAGRIADTGRDPKPMIERAVEMIRSESQIELIWASPRELLNVVQADEVGCHIITVTPGILSKLDLLGKDLVEYSLETVDMFATDARSAGYQL